MQQGERRQQPWPYAERKLIDLGYLIRFVSAPKEQDKPNKPLPGNQTALAAKQSADRDSVFTGTNRSQRDLSDAAETVHRHKDLRPSDSHERAEAVHGLCALLPKHTEHSSIDPLRSGGRLAVSSHISLRGNSRVRSFVADTYVLACKYARIIPARNEFVKFRA